MLFNYINIIIIDNKIKYRVEILLERKNMKYKKRVNIYFIVLTDHKHRHSII